jgi:hypothetical protein
MKKRLFLGFCIAISLPIAIHFFHLFTTLENTPTWSDDFLFLEMIPDLFDGASTKSLLAQLFASHNEIHRIAFARIWVALYYLITHEINFKNLILLANLQMIFILIPFYGYLKRQNLSSLHLIPITLILFSGFGNLDNYSLIGSLQHTSSILFMVWISYGLLLYEDKKWVLLLALFYPFVSSEGIAFIPMVAVILWIQKNKWAPFFSFLGVGIIGFYMANYHPQQKANLAIETHTFFELGQGFLGFLGIFRLPFSDSHRSEIAALLGLIVFAILIFSFLRAVKKQTFQSLAFPFLIYAQIMATGALICIGRFQMGDILDIAISERFFTYGLIGLILIYFILIHQFEFLRRSWTPGLLVGLVFFTLSTYFSIIPTKDLSLRLQADLINTFYQKKSSAYEGQIYDFNLLHNSRYYRFPDSKIPTLSSIQEGMKNASIFKIPGEYSFRTKGNIRAIYFENLPLKKAYDRFLVIRSIEDPKVFICHALTYDEKPLGPKMANVWLPKDVILAGNEYYLFSLDHKKVVDVLKLDGEPTRLE